MGQDRYREGRSWWSRLSPLFFLSFLFFFSFFFPPGNGGRGFLELLSSFWIPWKRSEGGGYGPLSYEEPPASRGDNIALTVAWFMQSHHDSGDTRSLTATKGSAILLAC